MHVSSARKIPSHPADIPAAGPARSRHLSALWIAWSAHRRTTGLCAAWEVPLRVIRSERRRGIRRWIGQALGTVALLRRHRPAILFIQNPSLALTVLSFLTRRLFGFSLVIDAHNEGVRPFDRPGRVVRWLTQRALHGADATIVSNAALAADVTAAGGRPIVLADRLPVPPPLAPTDRATEKAPEVAVIATFRPDEPIAGIMAAAAKLPEVRFAFSGDESRFRESGVRLPANVRLTGFLPDGDYWKLLARAEVVCDLTLKPDCLVCGAYEALALGKPMVLSDNAATREIFGPAAILTGSESDEIADALHAALDQRETLAAHACALRETYMERWQKQSAAAWDAVLAGVAARSRGAV